MGAGYRPCGALVHVRTRASSQTLDSSATGACSRDATLRQCIEQRDNLATQARTCQRCAAQSCQGVAQSQQASQVACRKRLAAYPATQHGTAYLLGGRPRSPHSARFPAALARAPCTHPICTLNCLIVGESVRCDVARLDDLCNQLAFGQEGGSGEVVQRFEAFQLHATPRIQPTVRTLCSGRNKDASHLLQRLLHALW